MQRYMKHPDHGVMPVYDNSEIERNKKNGWVEYVYPETNTEKKAEKSLEDQYEDKFGKKPHHLMKPENIKKALE